MEKKLKKPPEFIFFERYDSKTSFGFDDFEEKVKKQDVSIEILYFRTSKTNFPAASPDELLKKNKFTEISENLDESTETLLSLQSLNPGIQNRVFSDFTEEDLSHAAFMRFGGIDSADICFLGPLDGRKKEMLLGIILASYIPEEMRLKDVFEFAENFQGNFSLKVFVSSVCPSCPPAAIVCGLLSLINKNIKTEIVDVKYFKKEADAYGVIGLPRIFLNETTSITADSGPARLLEGIKKAAGN